MFDDQDKHRRLVERVRRFPGWIAGGILDWYQWLLPVQNGETYFRAVFRCDPRDSIQRSILFFGVWEPGVSEVITDRLRPGDVFVDIGANIGYDSLLAAEVADVIAIEASPVAFRQLEGNLALNPRLASRVRTVNVAVSDQPGELDLYGVGRSNLGGTTTLPGRRGTRFATVPAAPLRDVLEPDEMARIRLMKMDVEGAEPAILNDVLDHLDAYPVDMDIIVEANPEDGQGEFRRLWDRLTRAGFTGWAIENHYGNRWYAKWTPTPLRRLTEAPTTRQDLLLTRA